MTLQESVEILKTLKSYHLVSEFKDAIGVVLDAIERSIDIEQWDAEESQIEEICQRCNGQGCTKCS